MCGIGTHCSLLVARQPLLRRIYIWVFSFVACVVLLFSSKYRRAPEWRHLPITHTRRTATHTRGSKLPTFCSGSTCTIAYFGYERICRRQRRIKQKNRSKCDAGCCWNYFWFSFDNLFECISVGRSAGIDLKTRKCVQTSCTDAFKPVWMQRWKKNQQPHHSCNDVSRLLYGESDWKFEEEKK